VRVELPLAGRWRVHWGGEEAQRNLPASARPDRRYGYDLVALDGDGAGASVSAPCDGRVVAVRGLGASPSEDLADLGTHVVLEVAPGQYLFLAGLAPDGVEVEVGAALARGAPVGRLAASTPSPFTRGPHLCMHLQDTPVPLWGQGIPLEFAELLVNGAPVARAQPRGRSGRDPGRVPGDVVERVR
jgi:hypothetical protein